MRNYALNNDVQINERLRYDVIIIGAGVAGLYAALNVDSSLKCAIFNKLGAEESNSNYAQGGIATVRLAGDTVKSHYDDTLAAGAGLCDKKAVEILVTEGPKEIENLIKIGVPFDRDANNNLSISMEAAHSCNRIVHCGGDATGYYLTKTLTEAVRQKENVDKFNYYTLTDIMTNDNNEVTGVIVLDNAGKYIIVEAQNVILAAGGIGRLYRNSTNSSSSTGDGIAAAIRAGVLVDNMEFVQFHPTALIHPDLNMRYFLISEALRGEGALLLNRKGERFMQAAHPMAELAPRDIVSRSIINEMKKNDLPNVYLDITFKSRDFLRKRFPQIYDACMKRGIDIAVNWIPVVPIQHYFMGGIKTDVNGRTNIDGIYSAGESSCTGVHGANRLASNSLLECLVFGKRCALDINNKNVVKTSSVEMPTISLKKNMEFDYETYRSQIRNYMTKKGGIIRNETELKEAIIDIGSYYNNLNNSNLYLQREIETLNMATVSLAVLKAALDRKESIGAHFRSDYVKQEKI